jgi:hypothetical protein
MKKLMNNPENVLMAHEPHLAKNPVVVPLNRVTNPEIEIRALKEDKSLQNRDINNPAKIKKRRRRSKRKKKRLSQIDVASNSQGTCSLASMQKKMAGKKKGAWREDGSNRYGRRRSVEYKDDKEEEEGKGCTLI